MPDKVRYFVWRQEGRAVAFSLCMVEGEDIFAEYLGLDYGCALDLHLYHYAFRDVVRWAMANGYKRFRSTGLNYDPKLHLRSQARPARPLCPPLLAADEQGPRAGPARARTHPCRSGAAPVPQLRRNVGVELHHLARSVAFSPGIAELLELQAL